MSDSQLRKALKRKFDSREFAPTDLPAFFEVFSQLGNQIEDIQDEVDGWDQVVEFDLQGTGVFWIAIEGGRLSNGSGSRPDAQLRLVMSGSTAAQIFLGEVDAEAALNSGGLKLEGDLQTGIRFYELLELVLEEIEY
jgi:hypothetical protein